MLEYVVPRVMGLLPVSWRRAIIGRPDNPSRLATLAHKLLNRLPNSESQVYECQGDLSGYRMIIDWSRFRSFVYGTWEPDVLSTVKTAVESGMTVIDVGAHIGYYSLLFAKLVGQNGRVIAFEPFPANYELLGKNIKLNGLSNVQTVPMALFSREERLHLTIPDDLPYSGNGSIQGLGGTRRFDVSATTLDAFLAGSEFQPCLIKMDTEGAEQEVLLGAAQTIERYHPKLLIELHHFDGKLEAHPTPRYLQNLGYDIQWIERAQMTSHILGTFSSQTPAKTRGTN